jgi:hypothetical protein
MNSKMNLVALLCVLPTPMTASAQVPPASFEECDFVTTADLSDPKAPTFAQHPVPTQKAVSAARLDLKSNPIAKTYRTVLRREMTEGPNYAGHYRVVVWGCGTSCAMFAVVDLENGKVITTRDFATVSGVHLAADDFLPGTASDGWGFRHKLDSSLLVVLGDPDEDESRSGAHYFIVQGEALRLIYTTRVNKDCSNSKANAPKRP